MTGRTKGTVYLLHFERPYVSQRSTYYVGEEVRTGSRRKVVQHYIGWADDLEHRLKEHRHGNGSRLMAAVGRVGINWECVRTWKASLNFEKQLKRSKNAARFCPICNPNAGEKT